MSDLDSKHTHTDKYIVSHQCNRNIYAKATSIKIYRLVYVILLRLYNDTIHFDLTY